LKIGARTADQLEKSIFGTAIQDGDAVYQALDNYAAVNMTAAKCRIQGHNVIHPISVSMAEKKLTVTFLTILA
jgi:hypothetical protein